MSLPHLSTNVVISATWEISKEIFLKRWGAVWERELGSAALKPEYIEGVGDSFPVTLHIPRFLLSETNKCSFLSFLI